MKKINKTNQTSMQKGFSLIELMVVLVIIGVLTAIVISQFAKASQRGKISETVSLIGSIQSAVNDITQANSHAIINEASLIGSNRLPSKYIEGTKLYTPFGTELTTLTSSSGKDYTIQFASASKLACENLSNAALMADAVSISIGGTELVGDTMNQTAVKQHCDGLASNSDYELSFTFRK
ncbi:prepilin-type N-terminal cleavage/methylation domain-containing protein [Cysteiniphilum litorale]|uniref:prepilin-type N-terminal cleavage/methylation domain-containing protein n=1 Tax=Cysteiniphilum litorale TaxID=2056700 RepID=UPI003F881D74